MDNIISLSRLGTGDVVVLKSGSPLMTVRVYAPGKNRQNSTVSVDWFMGEEHYTGVFFENQLMIPEYEETEE